LLPSQPPQLAPPPEPPNREEAVSSKTIKEPAPIPTTEPGAFKNLLSIFLGLILVGIIWLGALYATDFTVALWLGVLFVVVVSLFLLGRLALRRREDLQKLAIRRQAASLGKTDYPVYLEVIGRHVSGEVGQTWEMTDTVLLIGKTHKADVPLEDRQLDKRHCMIVSDEDRYYLENLTRRRTVLYGRRLTVGETQELQNGDLIALGKATVLQLRINHH
jgi:hypothetical protein